MSQLPQVFLDAPIAHRGLHDISDRRPENSRAAYLAAIAAGYGIETDLQLSKDGQAIVFHDYDLGRLTSQKGPVRQKAAAELADIPLSGCDEGIPTLPEMLSLVDGSVPLLIELKDQDGGMGPEVGPLERATAEALQGYDGPVAVMSFNPHSVAALAQMLPDVPRGLVTSAYLADDWPLPKTTCDRLREIPDYDRTGSCFISHEVTDLDRPRVAALKAQGAIVFCWTVTSLEQERQARNVAQNITFEGYLAPLPG